MPNSNPNCDTANADADRDAANANAYCDAANANTNCDAANANTNGYGYSDADAFADPASPDAKAAAHAVPSADAVRWLKSN